MKTNEKLYFAYGSNMNLNQMAFRCPDAEVVDTVRLEGYRLAFCMNGGGNGGATPALFCVDSIPEETLAVKCFLPAAPVEVRIGPCRRSGQSPPGPIHFFQC